MANKSEITKILKKKYPKLSIIRIEKIFKIVIENISKSLLEGKSCEIRKFATFSIKYLKKNPSARNPATGEKIFVPSRKKVAIMYCTLIRYQKNQKMFNF